MVAYCAAFLPLLPVLPGITIVAIGALLLPALTEADIKKNSALAGHHLRQLGACCWHHLRASSLWHYRQQMNLEQTVLRIFIAGILRAADDCAVVNLDRAQPQTPHSLFPKMKRLQHCAKSFAYRYPLFGARWHLHRFLRRIPAAAVTATYLLVIEVLIYREIPIRKLPKIVWAIDGDGRRHFIDFRRFTGLSTSLSMLKSQCKYSRLFSQSWTINIAFNFA